LKVGAIAISEELETTTAEELKGVSAEELTGVSAEELAGTSTDELDNAIAEELTGFSTAELPEISDAELAGLSVAELIVLSRELERPSSGTVLSLETVVSPESMGFVTELLSSEQAFKKNNPKTAMADAASILFFSISNP